MVRRVGVGVFGVVVAGCLLLARQTIAEPCVGDAEHLRLTLERVEVDGLLASMQDATHYVVDGGTFVVVDGSPDLTVIAEAFTSPSSSCTTPGRRFPLTVTDPFTGRELTLTFEAAR